MPSIYDQDLPRNAANYAPMSPLSFIERTAEVYPDRLAVVHGTLRQTWGETYARARRLASALQRAGVVKNDTVAVMLPNTPPMVEAHFGVPMAGAVLNTLNTRLDPEAIAFMLDHGEAKAVIVDPEFAPVMKQALAQRQSTTPVLVIDVEDALFTGDATPIGRTTYEAFLGSGDPAFAWQLPADEWDAICLNYTSGTTGNPKGVVYHHRGAAINAISNVLEWDMPKHAVYLWTLPMFHCNGWCFPWTVAALDAADVPLQRLVLSVDGGGACRGERLPAARGGAGHFRRHPHPRRHALLWRAHRARPAGQRASDDEGRHSLRGEGHGGGGRAAGLDDRGHGSHGLRPDACLRADRGVWPGHGLRQT